MRLRAPQCPAPQAAQRQLGEQFVEVGQHGAQPARRLGGELMDEGEIAAQQFLIAETACGGGQRGEQQADDFAADHRGQFQRGVDAILDHVLARFLDDRRHAFQVGDDQIIAAPQLRQGARAFQIVVQSRGRHHPGRLDEVRRQRFVQGRIDAFELFAIIAEFYAHGLIPAAGYPALCHPASHFRTSRVTPRLSFRRAPVSTTFDSMGRRTPACAGMAHLFRKTSRPPRPGYRACPHRR